MYELNGFARTKGREMPQGRTLVMGAVEALFNSKGHNLVSFSGQSILDDLLLGV